MSWGDHEHEEINRKFGITQRLEAEKKAKDAKKQKTKDENLPISLKIDVNKVMIGNLFTTYCGQESVTEITKEGISTGSFAAAFGFIEVGLKELEKLGFKDISEDGNSGIFVYSLSETHRLRCVLTIRDLSLALDELNPVGDWESVSLPNRKYYHEIQNLITVLSDTVQ